MKGKMIAAALLLSLFVVAPPPLANAAEMSTSEIESELICLCGCGQTIKSCPHENCGFAVPARSRIASLVKSGKTKEEIVEIFIKQYGEEVLAAPKKEGFNLLGYIMPFVAFILAGGLIMVIIRSWAAKGVRDEEETLPMTRDDFGSDIDRKIEKELEEMD